MGKIYIGVRMGVLKRKSKGSTALALVGNFSLASSRWL